MKRRDSYPLLLALAAGAACAILAPFACSPTSSFQNPRTVALGSPTDIAVMANANADAGAPYAYLFIAATDHNQLNVLDLTNPAQREFVRAPNPIEALAIPVVQGAKMLARDVGYTSAPAALADGGVVSAGTEFTGRYVYAANPALPAISIVGSKPDELIELQRLQTAGSVTAIAARALAVDGPSQLFYATRSGADAQLWKLDVPGTGVATAALAPTSLLTLPNTSVQALLPVPLPTLGAPHVLAVATRNAADGGGLTFLLDTDAPAAPAPQDELAFPGPVRLLALNPVVPNRDAPGANIVEVARYIYGALDESSCGGQEQCRGILAVSAVSHELARDVLGLPMLPIQQGNAIPLAMVVEPLVGVPYMIPPTSLPDGGTAPAAANTALLNLVGLVTYANSTIGLFDAQAMIPIDDDPGLPYADLNLLENDAGQAITPPLAVTGLTLGNGAARDENVYVTYEGVIPGFVYPPLDPNAPLPGIFPVDPAALTECQVASSDPVRCRLRVGDSVVFARGAQACTTESAVTAVGPDYIAISPPSPACAGATGFTFRAQGGSSRSFVITGTSSGYLGRFGPSDGTFAAGAPYFHPRPPDVFNSVNPEPAMRFSMVANPPDLQRDDRYFLALHSGFLPAFITVNNVGTVLGPTPFAYGLATLPAWPGGNPNDTFVSFPSFSVIGEFQPSSVSLETANSMSLYGVMFGALY